MFTLNSNTFYRIGSWPLYGKSHFFPGILSTFVLIVNISILIFTVGYAYAGTCATTITSKSYNKIPLQDDKSININNTDIKVNVRKVIINIKKSASVNTRKIYLGDIAQIKASDLVKEKLEKMMVGFAPRPGQFSIFNGASLKARIKSDNSLSTNIYVSVPDQVYIKRKSQKISRKILKRIFINYITRRTEHNEFKVRNFSIRGLNIYPYGHLSLPMWSTYNNGNVKGRVTIRLTVRIDHRDYGMISLSGWVDVFDNVLCASRTLERGTILSLQDVHMEKMNISNFFGDYFTNLAGIQGKVLKINVVRGRCITTDMVGEPALVHMGDMVKMVAAIGALKIVTSGIAKSDGKLNDQIRVENMRSRKIVYGIVKGKSLVDVLF